MTVQPDTPPDPRATAIAWHEVDALGRRTMRSAWRWGAALAEARAVTPHGEWLPRLAARGITPRTAQRAMQVAAATTLDEFVAAGSAGAALAALRCPADETAADAAPQPDPSRAHPAQWTDGVLDVAAAILRDTVDVDRGLRVLDPMAGLGGALSLRSMLGSHVDVVVSDIHVWDGAHPAVVQGDAAELPHDDGVFGAVVTSPPFGNRLADRLSVDGDQRLTYADRRGADAEEGDVSGMQWGDAYRRAMTAVWAECCRVLAPGGVLVVEVKDHIREGRWIEVAEWHTLTLTGLGMEPVALRHVTAAGVRGVANQHRRVGVTTVRALRRR